MLTRNKWIIGAAAITVTVGTAMGGPIDRSLIPADPAVVIHVDLEAARKSALGTYILENKQTFNLGGLDGLKAFGIDVTKDLHSATIVTSKGKPETGVVIVRTTPAVDTLWEHLRTEPHAKALTVGGYELLSWDDGGKKYGTVRKGSSAQGDTRTIYIAEDWELITSALQTADGKSPALAPSAGPANLSLAPVLHVDMREIPSDMRKPGDLPAQAMFGQLRTAALELGESESKPYLRAIMNYDGAETAGEMREVAQGLAAFAKLSARSEPALAPIGQAMAGMKIEAEGASVTISGSWTQTEARGLLHTLVSMDKEKKGKAGAKGKGNQKGDDDADDDTN